jgi:hypothetical protein
MLDEASGVVCVDFEALRIVLRAGQVALRKASSWKGASAQLLRKNPSSKIRSKLEIGRTIIKDNRVAIFQRFTEPPPYLAGAIAAVDCKQHRAIANGLVVQICARNFEGRHVRL